MKARESRTRSQNLMANFFAKSKAGPSIPSTGDNDSAESTDFDKVFKPFALRKGVEVAPINYLSARRKLSDGMEENPIVLLDDETLLPSPHVPVIRSPPVSLPGVVCFLFMAHIH